MGEIVRGLWYASLLGVAFIAVLSAIGVAGRAVGAVHTTSEHRLACQRSGFIDVVYVSGTAYCVRIDGNTSTLTRSPLYHLAQEQP